ncbi:MAG TPA: PQQ-binding-like beta-propeller repeat protein [Planctomycetaceae bacterium]|nr:PQQ-binding-like beta-propeller repeat protein [Planctomycetaceae bacterium]
MHRFSSTVLCFITLSSSAIAADWRQFRGTDTTGVAEIALSAEAVAGLDVAWTADLTGRGLSSPIIVGDKVFVTSSGGYRQDRLHVTCFAAKDGKELWSRQFRATGRTTSHPKTCVAAPTPASDGERIFALYSSDDLLCLDLDGNLLWTRALIFDYPNASNSLGMASSPLLVAGTLVVPLENDSQSVAVGIDPATGLTKWTIERPKRANWTSPAILPGKTPAEDLVLLQSSAGVAAVKPATGETVWNFPNGASTIQSSIVANGTVYVPSKGITALQIASGSANPEVLWQVERLAPNTASPIFYGDKLYVLNRANVLLCVDPKTGDIEWQQRTEGPFSATPVAAAGHLFFVNETGLTQIVKLGGDKGEVVMTKDLGQTVLATPSIAHNAVYIRSDGKLWKLAGK